MNLGVVVSHVKALRQENFLFLCEANRRPPSCRRRPLLGQQH